MPCQAVADKSKPFPFVHCSLEQKCIPRIISTTSQMRLGCQALGRASRFKPSSWASRFKPSSCVLSQQTGPGTDVAAYLQITFTSSKKKNNNNLRTWKGKNGSRNVKDTCTVYMKVLVKQITAMREQLSLTFNSSLPHAAKARPCQCHS